MKTKFVKIGAKNPEKNKISAAAKIIRNGGLVAFPTETVYGLGANALNAKAVAKIFRAKGRPRDDPLIVHVCDELQVYRLARGIDLRAKLLMDKFWPGPLTLVLKKSKIVPKITTGNLGTVAVRMPNHKIACALIHASKVPIAAPSANLFGKPSPTSARHVEHDLGGRIDCILDGGRARIGVESTVLDLSGKIAELLRPGQITVEQIEHVIGKIKVHPLVSKKGGTKEKLASRSPGMKYKHYAPRGDVIIIKGANFAKKARELASKYYGTKIGIITFGKFAKSENIYVKKLANSQHAARNLFRFFREFDELGVEIIIAQGLEEKGIGLAVMNRLKKAASKII